MNTARYMRLLLSQEWDSTNTNGKTPFFTTSYEVKKKTRRRNEDVVIISNVNPRTVTSSGISSTEKTVETLVQIDHRTLDSHEQLLRMRDETQRILETYITEPPVLNGEQPTIINAFGDENDFSRRSQQNYRYVKETTLREISVPTQHTTP